MEHIPIMEKTTIYGENNNGGELMADNEPVTKPLPEEIIKLLRK